MSSEEVDEIDLLKRSEAGDREAMRELSQRLETRGRALLHESRDWLNRLSLSVPLDRTAVKRLWSLLVSTCRLGITRRQRGCYPTARGRSTVCPLKTSCSSTRKRSARGSRLAARVTRMLLSGRVCSP